MQRCGYQSPIAASDFVHYFDRYTGHNNPTSAGNDYYHLDDYNYRGSVSSRCTVHR